MNRYLIIPAFIVLAMSAPAALQIGDSLHGFSVRSATDLPDVPARMWRMEHVQTGADLIWFERPDENRTFAIVFKTVPSDSTGVPHIMEHSVLCGSRKYPVKEPFVELRKSSMATFLNAMTGPDATYYPIASKNARDFLNLADVYLDAVFHPLSVVDDWAMRQEGWHYEFDGTNLTRNGIVYSEMKAVFGNPRSVGSYRLNALLFPDNTYGQCSGGDPEHIPDLTFEKYKHFHARFYHPSNARILLDGSIDLDATLALIDSYLKDFTRRPVDAEIIPQKPVSDSATVRYESADETHKTILMDGWVFGSFADFDRLTAMDLITDALADSNEAPLKRALLDAGLCEDVSFGVGDDQQIKVVVTAQNTDPEKQDECRRVIRRVFEKACREGLDRRRLGVLIDRLEFRRREVSENQRGLDLLYSIIADWLHGGDVTTRLRTTEQFARLRQRLETGWFEQVLREAVLDNPHHAEVTLMPSKTLGSERRAAELAALAKIKASMSEADLARTAADARRLRELQSAPDRPEDIAKLPRLRLRDIPVNGPLPRWSVAVEDGVTVIRPDVTVRGLFYLDLCFNLAGLTDAELTDAPFLATVLGELATKTHDTLILKNELDGKLGHFNVRTAATESGPQLIVHLAALDSQRASALKLVREVLLETRYDDTDAIGKLRQQRRDQLERSANAYGLGMAVARAKRSFGEKNRVNELFTGVSQLRHLQDDSCGDLAGLARKTFVRNRLLVSATGDLPDDYLRDLIAVFPQAHWDNGRPRPLTTNSLTPSEGYEANGMVGFTAFAAHLPEGQRAKGAYWVGSQIVNLEYCWPEIRVKGGAYGGRLGVQMNGDITFSSWRDPNLANTFSVFTNASAALTDFVRKNPSFEKYQVSVYSILDPCYAPPQMAGWIRSLHLNGRTPDDVGRLKREILETTSAELLEYAELLQRSSGRGVKCAFGRRELLDACKFPRIEKVMRGNKR